MKPMTLVVLVVLAGGCDQQRKTPLKTGKTNLNQAEAEEQARFTRLEGSTGYVYAYNEQVHTDVFYHLRRDCPRLEQDLGSTPTGKAVKVTFKDGTVVGEDGSLYKGFNCQRCCP